MLAIDIRESDVLVTAVHRPSGADRVRAALEEAGLQVHEVVPSHGDERVYRLTLSGDPEQVVSILQRIGDQPGVACGACE
jgi:hypothetical protein